MLRRALVVAVVATGAITILALVTPVVPTWVAAGAVAVGVLATGLAQGRVGAVAARLADATRERGDAIAEMAKDSRLFRSMIEDATDLVILVEDGVVQYASPAATRLFNCDEDALLGHHTDDLIHPDDREQAASVMTGGESDMVRNQRLVELRMRVEDTDDTAHGTFQGWYVLEGSARLLQSDDDAETRVVLNLRDITERRRLERELAHRASHDDVTGLANRALFRIRCQQAARQRTAGVHTTLLLMDLRGLDRLQNSLGQRAADAALREAARRVDSAIGESDLAARLNDHTLAVLAHHDQDIAMGSPLADRLLTQVTSDIALPEGLVRLHALAGTAPIDDTDSVDGMLAKAEVALDDARARGFGHVGFCPEQHARALSIRELETELEDGLARDEFRVHYQPLVDLYTQDVVGFEALVRWEHPTRGLVSPGDFIPAAERSGLIVPLGRWVLQEATRGLSRLQQQFPQATPLYVTVNVAAAQLGDASLVDDVRTAIAAAGIAPGTLTLEITESSLVDDVDNAVEVLDELRAAGCRIAIDDFGTGYSSLSQLQQFPLDILKIDRAFVQGLHDGGVNPAITEAIVSLGQRLELTTVAEGVETSDDLDTVLTLACNIGQGYFFGRPADERQAVATLQQRLADIALAERLHTHTHVRPGART